MIAFAGDVDFNIQYTLTTTIKCNVVFGLKIDAHVDEMLDYDLQETINNVHRTLTIEAVLTAAEASDMATFITDDQTFDKEITVDSTTYTVVNDPSNFKIDFGLWNKSNARAKIKMKFISGSWT